MLKHCSIILIVHIIISIPNFIVFSCVEEPHSEFQRRYSLPRSGHVHESRGIFPHVLRVGKRSQNRFVLRCLSARSSICAVIRAHGNMSYAHSVKRFFCKSNLWSADKIGTESVTKTRFMESEMYVGLWRKCKQF